MIKEELLLIELERLRQMLCIASKDVAKLTEGMDEVSKYIQDKVADTLQGFLDHGIEYDMDKTIQELRKENAELKARLNAIDLLTPELEKMSRLKKQQLIEAKGLLIGFISKMKNTVYTPYEKDLVERAEQFLKGLEK